MRVILPREARFHRTPDGATWIQSSTTYQFWQRYLQVFDSVTVLARIHEVESITEDFNRSDGPNIKFIGLPYYLGPFEYLHKRNAIKRVIGRSLNNKDAVILRSPGQISSSTRSLLEPGRPYGVEVVGDPDDVFRPGAMRHPMRPLLRQWFVRDLARTVRCAESVSYVTTKTLQQKYPARPDAFTTSYSSIELTPDAFVQEPRRYTQPLGSVQVTLVGSLEQMYKGVDVLISAVCECRKRDVAVSGVIVGGGRYQEELQELARRLGVDRQIEFLGQLPSGDAIRARLDESDLFILPSRTEGLPRAMIEAMARGIPCIGTRVGGIPELLDEEELVLADDPIALANKIEQVAVDPVRMTRLSATNLEKARRYRADLLQARRRAVYTHVKEATTEWQKIAP